MKKIQIIALVFIIAAIGVIIFTTSKDEASGPLADDPQKLALYKYIVSTNIPKGYTIADVKFLNKKGIIVYRKTLNK